MFLLLGVTRGAVTALATFTAITTAAAAATAFTALGASGLSFRTLAAGFTRVARLTGLAGFARLLRA
ncbi:MAG: hypothetical protein ACT6Q6_18970, partial [Hydrogenophaga sp.]